MCTSLSELTFFVSVTEAIGISPSTHIPPLDKATTSLLSVYRISYSGISYSCISFLRLFLLSPFEE